MDLGFPALTAVWTATVRNPWRLKDALSQGKAGEALLQVSQGAQGSYSLSRGLRSGTASESIALQRHCQSISSTGLASGSWCAGDCILTERTQPIQHRATEQESECFARRGKPQSQRGIATRGSVYGRIEAALGLWATAPPMNVFLLPNKDSLGLSKHPPSAVHAFYESSVFCALRCVVDSATFHASIAEYGPKM
ncbi:hypothetical protein PV04_06403 [Phialophora macrospora]|uniref:Uncharacterized protein n=1 Tax=Phialophora macrospora TaxID=1851006 RepID=A0A0D2CPN7_9EURO|nr:hypothetical protein PV04_06403 [Phialophora macrospora]